MTHLRVSGMSKAGMIAGIWAGALLATSSAYAVPGFATVDGITFGTNQAGQAAGNFKTTTLYENTVAKKGDLLDGIGIVNTIKAIGCAGAGGLCWQNLQASGANNYELTYRFTNFLVQKIAAIDATNAIVWFSGGITTLYSQNLGPGGTQNFDQTGNLSGAAGKAAAITSATNGNVWLNMKGAPTGTVCEVADSCFSGLGTAITLESTFKYSGSLSNVASGDGFAFFDVDTALTGAANSYFDTNEFPAPACTGSVLACAGYTSGPEDLAFNSSFQKDLNSGNGTAKDKFPLSGSGNLRQQTVPEPGSLLLLGTGLLALAGFRRRRSRA